MSRAERRASGRRAAPPRSRGAGRPARASTPPASTTSRSAWSATPPTPRTSPRTCSSAPSSACPGTVRCCSAPGSTGSRSTAATTTCAWSARRPLAAAPGQEAPSPHDPYEQSELQRLLEASLGDLTRRQRAALLLKDVHGLSLVEVARLPRPHARVGRGAARPRTQGVPGELRGALRRRRPAAAPLGRRPRRAAAAAAAAGAGGAAAARCRSRRPPRRRSLPHRAGRCGRRSPPRPAAASARCSACLRPSRRRCWSPRPPPPSARRSSSSRGPTSGRRGPQARPRSRRRP